MYFGYARISSDAQNGIKWRARNENEILKEIITWIRFDLIANALTAKTIRWRRKQKSSRRAQERKKQHPEQNKTEQKCRAPTMVAAMKYLMLSGK